MLSVESAAMMDDVFNALCRHKIVPAIILDRAEQAGGIADALMVGGLPVAEVTFRSDAAVPALREMSKRKDLILGAGTVLTIDQVKQAADAGATYIVSPGFSDKIVSYCIDHKLLVIPGCTTATEVTRAFEFGLTVVKFFPVELLGGLKMVKAISAAFSTMKYMPTGGVNEANLAEYLSFKPIVMCGGSWMVTKEMLANDDYAKITAVTKKAVAIAKG